MEPDYYEVLEVAPEASRDEIKAHYRLAVREHHPDAAPVHAKETAHAKIQLIIAAWTILGDVPARAAYDERRRRAQAQAPLNLPLSGTPSQGAPQGTRGQEQAPDGRKRSRVQAVMGGSSSPRPVNPRTRLLAMVFDAAQMYHVEGRPEEAARVCQNVLRADPTNAEAAVLLADIYAAQNQRAAALDLLERALRLQPSNALYRSKWEALRHASPEHARPSTPAAPPPRATAANPWSKVTPANPLASRIADRAPLSGTPAPPEEGEEGTAPSTAGAAYSVVAPIPEPAGLAVEKPSTEQAQAPASAQGEKETPQAQATAQETAQEPEPRSSLLQRLRSKLSR